MKHKVSNKLFLKLSLKSPDIQLIGSWNYFSLEAEIVLLLNLIILILELLNQMKALLDLSSMIYQIRKTLDWSIIEARYKGKLNCKVLRI